MTEEKSYVRDAVLLILYFFLPRMVTIIPGVSRQFWEFLQTSLPMWFGAGLGLGLFLQSRYHKFPSLKFSDLIGGLYILYVVKHLCFPVLVIFLQFF